MTTLFRIEPDRLCLRCEQAGLDEFRPLTAAAEPQFRGWLQDYHNPLRGYGDEPARLRLGRELYAWLDGDAGWLARLREAAEPPGSSNFARRAIPASWPGRFSSCLGNCWPTTGVIWRPIWRCAIPRCADWASRAHPGQPSPCRLSLVFMAAAPRDQLRLDYEAEETAILDATEQTGLDLTVEESGALKWLATCVAREAPVDVLHLSCHGQGGAEPALCLETDEGATHLASVRAIG